MSGVYEVVPTRPYKGKLPVPKESGMLRGEPELFLVCPRCESKPFGSFMRGIVQRGWQWWRPWRRRPERYCAVICDRCQHIVGWEGFTNEERLERALG